MCLCLRVCVRACLRTCVCVVNTFTLRFGRLLSEKTSNVTSPGPWDLVTSSSVGTFRFIIIIKYILWVHVFKKLYSTIHLALIRTNLQQDFYQWQTRDRTLMDLSSSLRWHQQIGRWTCYLGWWYVLGQSRRAFSLAFKSSMLLTTHTHTRIPTCMMNPHYSFAIG